MHLDLQKKGISTDTRSVQENFNLITSFIQDSADKQKLVVLSPQYLG